MKYILFTLITFQVFALTVETPEIKFTGYKFTDKVGVSGTFKKIDWNLKETGESLKDILLGSSVKIDSHSIDAGKTARNINITNGLFKNWGAREITGQFVKVDEGKKIATLEFNVGETKNLVDMAYEVKEGVLKLSGTIDLIEMGFSEAFNKLGKICAVYHKGKDGVVKTWSEVLVEITTKTSN